MATEPVGPADGLHVIGAAAPTAGSVRVCVLLSPFLGSKNMQSAHRRYVVLPKAVRNMVQKVALRYGVEVNDFKSKRREYDDSSDLPVDLLAEGAVVIDVCTRALDDVFSRTTEFHRMLHMWHAVSNIGKITDEPGSFEPCHDKGYVFDVVGHCQFTEVFHKQLRSCYCSCCGTLFICVALCHCVYYSLI